MSKATFVVSVLSWLLALGCIYAWCLHRYEAGRKVTLLGWGTPKVGPVRMNRIPAVWATALFLVWFVPMIFVFAAGTDLEARGFLTPQLALAILAAGVGVQLAVLALHNRGASQWPKPGWYDDANNAELMRWWNGIEWTQHTYPRDRYVADPFAQTSA